MNQIFHLLKFQEFINFINLSIGKNMFFIVKNRILTHWQFCAHHNIFDLRKDSASTLTPLSPNVKGTLMQISNFHYMFGFIYKPYPENFVYLILRILELFTREFCIFLKK